MDNAYGEAEMSDLVAKLRHAMATEMNDDVSEPRSDKRTRHVARVAAMDEAADHIAALEAERDRLRDALKAAEEYMAFRSTEQNQPYPLEKARAALQEGE